VSGGEIRTGEKWRPHFAHQEHRNEVESLARRKQRASIRAPHPNKLSGRICNSLQLSATMNQRRARLGARASLPAACASTRK